MRQPSVADPVVARVPGKRSVRRARTDGFGGFRSALPFLAVGLILYAVFLLYPVVQAVRLSFFHWDGINAQRFAGLANFRELFSTDQVFSQAFGNTLLWTALGVIVPNILALALAVALNGRIRGRIALRAVFYLPAVLATVVVAMTWNLLYDPTVGLVNDTLHGIGLANLTRPWLGDPNFALIAVFIASVWQGTGVGMVLFLGGLQSVRPELIDAARVDGASRWRVFLHVELPGIRPTLAVVLMLSVVNALKGFDLIYAMTQGGPAGSSQVLASYAWITSVTDRDFGLGSAIGTILLAMTIIAVIPYVRWVVREMGQR